MKTLFVRYKMFLLLVCLGLALLLAGCGGDEEATDTPPPGPTETGPPPTEPSPPTGTPTPEIYLVSTEILTTTFPAVPQQVMLSGRAIDITAVVSHEILGDFRLTPVGPPPGEGFTFAPPSLPEEQSTAGLYRIANSGSNIPPRQDDIELTAVLYHIGNQDKDISSTIRAVYDAVIAVAAERSNAKENPVIVLAEPNRFVAMPWGVDADPWGGNADPWGVDADPAAGGTMQAQIPGESDVGVWNQWALVGQDGIGLYNTGVNPPERWVVTQGKDVEVFIFDTSPFSNAGRQEVMGLPLVVHHPHLPVDIPSINDSNVRQHGLFVAGLVRLVAPSSQLNLVRILNADGLGDVFSFLVVLNQFAPGGSVDRDIVFNLSLSLQEYKDDEQPRPTLEQQEAIEAWLPKAYHRYLEATDGVPLALEMMMQKVYDDGAVIVAASGNGSDRTVNVAKPAGMPARFVTTVGVAGSNIQGELSCFSNNPELPGGLRAPAGEGVPQPHPEIAALPRSTCHYPFPWRSGGDRCPASSTGGYDCEVALTSVIITGTGEITFAHWVGTSFATPLVTGAAALIMDAGNDQCDQAEVTGYLRSWSGVLNIPTAVADAPATCSP